MHLISLSTESAGYCNSLTNRTEKSQDFTISTLNLLLVWWLLSPGIFALSMFSLRNKPQATKGTREQSQWSYSIPTSSMVKEASFKARLVKNYRWSQHLSPSIYGILWGKCSAEPINICEIVTNCLNATKTWEAEKDWLLCCKFKASLSYMARLCSSPNSKQTKTN